MKDRKYRIGIVGKLVDVTEEQYLAYYRDDRRMRYFERDIKTERAKRDKYGKIIGYTPSREDSLDRLLDSGEDFRDESESAEDAAIRLVMSDKLHTALEKLPRDDRELITALFFSNGGVGMTERDYSKISGIPQQTINSRKAKILSKLKKLL